MDGRKYSSVIIITTTPNKNQTQNQTKPKPKPRHQKPPSTSASQTETPSPSPATTAFVENLITALKHSRPPNSTQAAMTAACLACRLQNPGTTRSLAPETGTNGFLRLFTYTYRPRFRITNYLRKCCCLFHRRAGDGLSIAQPGASGDFICEMNRTTRTGGMRSPAHLISSRWHGLDERGWGWDGRQIES